MNLSRRMMMTGIAGVLTAASFGRMASAATTIKVSLWDKGATSLDMMDPAKPMGMAMMGGDMAMVTMGITVDQVSIPAGEITFQAINDSKDLIHEMVISPVADVTKALPYIADEMKVDEDAAGHVGEVAELEPGQSGSLTLTLKPGTYILYCNIPAHYAMGMWTLVTVTE